MMEKRFSLDLDSAAGLITGFLLLAIALVVFIGNQIGIRATVQLPADNIIGPYETLTLVFSEPIEASLAIERFAIQPNIKGKFEWADSKTMHFIPVQPFEPEIEYTLVLTPGILTNNGKSLKKPLGWKFQVRSPKVVYMVADQGKSRLWTVDLQSEEPIPLTDDTFKILNFDA